MVASVLTHCPPIHNCSHLDEAVLPVVEVLLILGQADGVHVTVQPELCLQEEESDRVLQVLGVELLVGDARAHIPEEKEGSMVISASKKIHPKVRNHGEGLLLVESGYYRFHI